MKKIIKIEKNGCVPCVVLGNMINDLKPELDEMGVEVETINVSLKPEAIEQYKVTSVPVLIFDHNGYEATHRGLLSRENFLSEVSRMVSAHE